jgi:hypothetical protein
MRRCTRNEIAAIVVLAVVIIGALAWLWVFGGVGFTRKCSDGKPLPAYFHYALSSFNVDLAPLFNKVIT